MTGRNETAYLNLLHRRLAHSGLLDNGVSVHLVLFLDSVSHVLGLAGKLKSLRTVEAGGGVNVTSFLHLNAFRFLSSSSSYNDKTSKKVIFYPS